MRLWSALLLLVALLPACDPAPSSDRPADFALVRAWDTGSLPPEYQRSRKVTVAASGEATAEWSLGYGEASRQVAFRLDGAAMDSLYVALVAAGLFAHDWAEDPEPPVGGPSWSLRATAAGEGVRVPRFVAAHGEAKARVGEAVEGIVPAAVTAELLTWADTTAVGR